MPAVAVLAAVAWSAGSLAAVLLLARLLDGNVAPWIGVSSTRLLLVSMTASLIARRLARRAPAIELRNSRLLHRLLLTTLLVAMAALAFRFGADSVGGSDSAGYLAQAQRWRRGALSVPLALDGLPVSDTAWLQSPLGFRPAPGGDATVPIYPPGWPLLLALALPVGDGAAVRVLPAAAALLAMVGLYGLARSSLRRSAALLATAAFAFSPPFLFQALQPMADVATLAAWLVALAAAPRPHTGWRVTAGIAAAVAVAIRPNLVPLLVVIGWMATREASSRRDAAARAALVLTPGVVTSLCYMYWQATLYGSAVTSGYGTAADLFSVSYIRPNLARQAAWIVESHGWPAVVALMAGVGASMYRRLIPRPVLASAVIVWLLYLLYLPFDNWTYLRFVLLPLAVVTIAFSGALDAFTSRHRPSVRLATLSAALVLIVASNLVVARHLGVFDLYRHESRYRLAAGFTRDHAPESLVVLASQHSASITAYTGLPVVRLDLLSPAEAEPLLDWLHSRHHAVAVVIDDDERARVMEPLAAVDRLRLDWPARARIGSPGRTRVWFLDDRMITESGGHITTTTAIWPRRR